jgi:hypothetical protein
MTIKIQHKRSAVAGKAPVVGDLAYGEIAINYNVADLKLYTRASDDTIHELGGKPADASTTVKGIVQLADPAAITAGTAGRVVDAAQLKAHAPADASTTVKGIVQLADPAAITAGTSGRVVDAAQLKAHAPADASTTVKGIIQLATAAEVLAGTDALKAVTPKEAKDHYLAKDIANLPLLP